MSTLRNLVSRYAELPDIDVDWLELLTADWQLLADLALGDVVLWAPTIDGDYIAVAHSRPAGSVTLFYRDVLGDLLRDDWRELVEETVRTGAAAVSTSPAWYEENPMKLTAYSVSRKDLETGEQVGPIAVATVHTSLNDGQSASRIGAAFRECADDLFAMIQLGLFPTTASSRGRERGAPRAADGLVRVDPSGEITFASPNTQTTFTMLGYRDEMEGENFSDVVHEVVRGQFDTNESLPLITQGKVAKRSDIEALGRVVTLRSIPVTLENARSGGIVLTRDITDLRQQEQELITKDATIREIHHRVKNNLQTVASLLRVQARRARSEDAKEALSQAMRRVAAIAVVHDTLATGLSQIVSFDEVFDRVVGLAAEVASIHNTTVHLRREGRFGELPSEYATPLALALTEIVTNAVEHGLAGMEGEVAIVAERNEERLLVQVTDTGTGLPGGTVGDGLGTQIVRTLIQGELGGSIEWGPHEGGGTRVAISIPLHWIASPVTHPLA
ncbi:MULTISPECIES: sensor histidine kinase [unclassified Leucobacter]|uniref:sensor histidine kinase n=1 Tax=unclassified Leucobacter TaxID=2621730 RepID=UPI00165E4F83|nr:histidine kinase N-terminal domain-containing protein [Leucobacter sp. CX169]MBC9928114.1 histidine kinase N-terminal domain-containing protein [Leucobacter sp. cx-169]MBC9936784.1 histidine kinase N-terminal domain-containing protein [Leucobacter sp. cx-87]